MLLWKHAKNLRKSILEGNGLSFLKFFCFHVVQGVRTGIRNFYGEFKELKFTNSPSEKEVGMIRGLHSLLPKCFFSIVIKVENFSVTALDKLIISAFNQTAPHFEVILLGDIDQTIFKKYDGLKFNVNPKGDWVVFLNQHMWLRVDFLYRYHQLITHESSLTTVFHTNPVFINQKDELLHGTINFDSVKLNFPFEFRKVEIYGCAMPRSFWLEFASSRFLINSLDAQGATFVSVPHAILAVRDYLNAQSNAYFPEEFKEDFKKYVAFKKLGWEIKTGLTSDSIRAIPPLDSEPNIQVVIPYKDSRELTVAAVQSAFQSKNVKVHITMVDNGSSDRKIGKELTEMGCEVLRIDEPFNYSRLNNLAVSLTVSPQPLILFLNNDAELDPFALEEMARWATQSEIGAVGCRLHYPTGEVQHVGVSLNQKIARAGIMNWFHKELGKNFEDCKEGKVIHISDAVTAACVMLRRDEFIAVGGFDEVLYPVAYSDTNLNVKLARKGLKSLYTPFAMGTHHESKSRVSGQLEDFDRSLFLHNFQLQICSRGQSNCNSIE